MVVYYLIILLLSPLLVTCSSISSSSYINTNTSFSSILCHPHESAALIAFINSIAINQPYPDPYSADVQSWKKGSDCCGWDGIKCDPTSHHVFELDLTDSGLVGTLDSNSTLFHLRHLRFLSLSSNDFSQSTISPMFGSSFPYLEQLYLSSSNFRGEVPPQISQLSKLKHLVLSSYDGYYSIDFDSDSNSLEMKMSTFYNIVSNMTHLKDLLLGGVNINSTFPSSFTNLSSLQSLHLRGCNLRGELPVNFLKLRQLENINLGRNHGLYANFRLSNWSSSLGSIDLSNVNFSSELPASSSSVQSQYSRLEVLYLRGCSFHGPFPNWMWNHFVTNNSSLFELDLSDNKFNGTINFDDIHYTPCNLSNTVPLYGFLNISHNYLTGSLTSLPWNYEGPLDLSYNMFNGSLPILPLDVMWFSASNNNFTGPIPSSLCNLTGPLVLDLSNNSFKDELPHCFGNITNSLIVLNLGSNMISGTLPDNTFSNCDRLQHLDLSVNMLEGLVPRSLAHCIKLKVVNLRNNKLRDEFPHWLGNLSHIQVLDLSYNGFFGSLAFLKLTNPFPQLQVLDLSNNNFSGMISTGYVESFKAMMNNSQRVIGSPIYLDSGEVYSAIYYYSATLIINGVALKYNKIITTLAILDLSNNKFEGKIPDNLGKLVSINSLNLSHNQLIGPIPRSLGNLRLLDFLDLSSNKLTGQIPRELTSLTFLGVFNVSENRLVGPIPHGNNFNTFPVNSYNGNLGLCGFPLPDCGEHGKPRPQLSKDDNKDEDVGMMLEWKVVVMGSGFGTFVSFVWGCYMLSIGRPIWLLKLVLILVDKVEKMFGRRRRRPTRGRH